MSSAVRSGVFGDPVAYQGCTSSWLGADEALVVRALYSPRAQGDAQALVRFVS